MSAEVGEGPGGDPPAEPAMRAEVGQGPGGDPPTAAPSCPPSPLAGSPRPVFSPQGGWSRTSGGLRAGLLHCSRFLQKAAGGPELQVVHSVPHLH